MPETVDPMMTLFQSEGKAETKAAKVTPSKSEGVTQPASQPVSEKMPPNIDEQIVKALIDQSNGDKAEAAKTASGNNNTPTATVEADKATSANPTVSGYQLSDEQPDPSDDKTALPRELNSKDAGSNDKVKQPVPQPAQPTAQSDQKATTADLKDAAPTPPHNLVHGTAADGKATSGSSHKNEVAVNVDPNEPANSAQPAMHLHRTEANVRDVLQMDGGAPLRPMPAQPIVGQIVDQVRLLINNDGRSEMRLQLRPESLGKLDVRVVVEDGMVTVRLGTESLATRGLIESNLNHLKHAFNEHGLRADQVVVYVNNGDSNAGGYDQAAFQRQGQPQPGHGQVSSDAGQEKQLASQASRPIHPVNGRQIDVRA